MNLQELRDPRTPRARARHWAVAAGFTLLELMVVMAIILVLLAMAAGRYDRSVTSAREAALKQDLWVMRQAIDQYALDKQAAPQSLDDLVSSGYLRQVPVDPITRAKDWKTETSDIALSPEQTSSGITEVHSNSAKVSPSTNTAYNTW